MTGVGADRLLVVGASGLVGAELVRQARSAGVAVRGVARHVRGEATEALDLADRRQVARLLEDARPTVVAICSAWPDVDGCERDPERSERENVATAANLLAETRDLPVRVVFYSTDHVFDGRRDVYGERDATNPLSVYARHKRRVEEMLLAAGNALVVRTSWVFGLEQAEKNFLYRVCRAVRAGERLRLPVRQAGCPTFAQWLATGTLRLLADGLDGIVHLAGAELLTKAAWAGVLARGLGLPPCETVEVPWAESGQVAPRPERVVLRSERHALRHPPLASVLAELRMYLSAPRTPEPRRRPSGVAAVE